MKLLDIFLTITQTRNFSTDSFRYKDPFKVNKTKVKMSDMLRPPNIESFASVKKNVANVKLGKRY